MKSFTNSTLVALTRLHQGNSERWKSDKMGLAQKPEKRRTFSNQQKNNTQTSNNKLIPEQPFKQHFVPSQPMLNLHTNTNKVLFFLLILASLSSVSKAESLSKDTCDADNCDSKLTVNSQQQKYAPEIRIDSHNNEDFTNVCVVGQRGQPRDENLAVRINHARDMWKPSAKDKDGNVNFAQVWPLLVATVHDKKVNGAQEACPYEIGSSQAEFSFRCAEFLLAHPPATFKAGKEFPLIEKIDFEENCGNVMPKLKP